MSALASDSNRAVDYTGKLSINCSRSPWVPKYSVALVRRNIGFSQQDGINDSAIEEVSRMSVQQLERSLSMGSFAASSHFDDERHGIYTKAGDTQLRARSP